MFSSTRKAIVITTVSPNMTVVHRDSTFCQHLVSPVLLVLYSTDDNRANTTTTACSWPISMSNKNSIFKNNM